MSSINGFKLVNHLPCPHTGHAVQKYSVKWTLELYLFVCMKLISLSHFQLEDSGNVTDGES